MQFNKDLKYFKKWLFIRYPNTTGRKKYIWFYNANEKIFNKPRLFFTNLSVTCRSYFAVLCKWKNCI